ncbi:hypothetical protein B0H10DRAFT_1945150 [Mycena sp. CBHHK59/15]|nr:hypothetical protein B0H10DRAFT_1945150 [Mycena sp. CBHHK59/15]
MPLTCQGKGSDTSRLAWLTQLCSMWPIRTYGFDKPEFKHALTGVWKCRRRRGVPPGLMTLWLLVSMLRDTEVKVVLVQLAVADSEFLLEVDKVVLSKHACHKSLAMPVRDGTGYSCHTSCYAGGMPLCLDHMSWRQQVENSNTLSLWLSCLTEAIAQAGLQILSWSITIDILHPRLLGRLSRRRGLNLE